MPKRTPERIICNTFGHAFHMGQNCRVNDVNQYTQGKYEKARLAALGWPADRKRTLPPPNYNQRQSSSSQASKGPPGGHNNSSLDPWHGSSSISPASLLTPEGRKRRRDDQRKKKAKQRKAKDLTLARWRNAESNMVSFQEGGAPSNQKITAKFFTVSFSDVNKRLQVQNCTR
jgi:hypothetical protein